MQTNQTNNSFLDKVIVHMRRAWRVGGVGTQRTAFA